MDHKVSKDMISSGMIPSGEKTQADLGRTQYGSAPSPSSLVEAYRSIYEHHQKDADGKVIEHDEKEELNEGKMPEGLKNYLMKKGKKKDDKDMKEMYGDSASTKTSTTTTTQTKPVKKPGGGGLIQKLKDRTTATNAAINQMNDVDLFDLVKGKLIDEGCDEQEAIKIMVNLSEEELNELLGGKPGDGYLGHPNLGIKNPFAKKQTKKPVIPNSKGGGLINKTAAQLGDRNMKLKQMIDDI
jgi:hypothetical protein